MGGGGGGRRGGEERVQDSNVTLLLEVVALYFQVFNIWVNCFNLASTSCFAICGFSTFIYNHFSIWIKLFLSLPSTPDLGITYLPTTTLSKHSFKFEMFCALDPISMFGWRCKFPLLLFFSPFVVLRIKSCFQKLPLFFLEHWTTQQKQLFLKNLHTSYNTTKSSSMFLSPLKERQITLCEWFLSFTGWQTFLSIPLSIGSV